MSFHIEPNCQAIVYGTKTHLDSKVVTVGAYIGDPPTIMDRGWAPHLRDMWEISESVQYKDSLDGMIISLSMLPECHLLRIDGYEPTDDDAEMFLTNKDVADACNRLEKARGKDDK